MFDFKPAENFPHRSPLDLVESVKDLIEGKVVCDLGCGAGDLLRAASKYASKVIGVEQNPTRVAAGQDNDVEIKVSNFFSDLPKADVYFCWVGTELETSVINLIAHQNRDADLLIFRRLQNVDQGFTNSVDELLVANYKEEFSDIAGWATEGQYGIGIKRFTYLNEPSLQSSYFGTGIGKTLYDHVLKNKPETIVEFGVLHGYSTVCMAQALKRLGKGKIIAYDMWEKAPYGHDQTMAEVQKALEHHDVADYVELRYGDFHEKTWESDGISPDLMHLDINNTGEILPIVSEFEFPVLFEGGSAKRDDVWWMVKFDKEKMHPLKKLYGYEVLNNNFPSISIINHK